MSRDTAGILRDLQSDGAVRDAESGRHVQIVESHRIDGLIPADGRAVIHCRWRGQGIQIGCRCVCLSLFQQPAQGGYVMPEVMALLFFLQSGFRDPAVMLLLHPGLLFQKGQLPFPACDSPPAAPAYRP